MNVNVSFVSFLVNTLKKNDAVAFSHFSVSVCQIQTYYSYFFVSRIFFVNGAAFDSFHFVSNVLLARGRVIAVTPMSASASASGYFWLKILSRLRSRVRHMYCNFGAVSNGVGGDNFC